MMATEYKDIILYEDYMKYTAHQEAYTQCYCCEKQ